MSFRVLAIFLGLVASVFVQSQPPTPALRDSESSPPANQTQKDQPDANPHDPQAALVGTPNSQDHSEDGKPSSDNKPSSDCWLIFLTFLLVVVGAVQAGVYICQGRLMRETLNHTRESSEKQLRAYVTLAPEDDKAPEDPHIFRINLKNSGQTPAYQISASFGWKFFQGAQTDWLEGTPFTVVPNANPSVFTLGAGVKFPADQDLSWLKDRIRFEAELNQADRGLGTLYVFGTIRYRDVFRKDRFTNYCFRHIAGKSLSKGAIYSLHNDSDSD